MQLLIIFIVVGLIINIFKTKIKGYLGEAAVANRLAKLPQEQYRILNDIMLKTKHGTISQIDHIVVSIYGIFVIETKNYKGWITGSEFGEQWTKNMYGKKYSFCNPLKQNYGHMKVLEEKLHLSEEKFIPIVVFGGNAALKVDTSKSVIYIRQLR